MRKQSKPSILMAFLNADFKDFQDILAVEENPDNAILMFTYAKLLEKRTLGIVRRTLIIGKPDVLHRG